MRTLTLLVLGWTLCPAPVFADRGAIEQTLADMSRTVLAADADGYLSHVSHADPIFLKEQQNWAKDLSRRAPAEVQFAIADPPPEGDKDDEDAAHAKGRRSIAAPRFGEKTAKFEMVTSWTMPAERKGDEPRDRSVSFPVVFVLDEVGKWVYAGEDWLTLESAADEVRPRDVRFQGPGPTTEATASPAKAPERRARVKYFAGYESAARQIVDVLPAVREHVDEGFQNEVPRVQEVKIYPSMSHLQESIYLSYVDGLSGWNEPGEAIKLLVDPRRTSRRAMTTLLAHEYGHVATFEFGEKANDMPWWVLEGVAELSSERFTSVGKDAENAVLHWQRNDALAAWEDLADFHKVQESSERDLQAKVYKQGQYMLMYISDRFGRDGRNAWLRAMATGKTIDEASRDAFKMSFADLDGQWREYVKERSATVNAERAARENEARKDEKDKKGGEEPRPRENGAASKSPASKATAGPGE